MSKNQTIKDAILEAALPNVPFDGWALQTLENAAVEAGYDKSMARAVFPRGAQDALVHFSGWADRKMLDGLKKSSGMKLRVREKVTLAVRTRFEMLEPYREAERLAIAFWVRPFRKWEGARLVWKTADAVWDWVGDTATDYNRYTKRGLLAGVLTATSLFWLADESKSRAESWAFLDRRIDNVLSLGKIAGRLKTA